MPRDVSPIQRAVIGPKPTGMRQTFMDLLQSIGDWQRDNPVGALTTFLGPDLGAYMDRLREEGEFEDRIRGLSKEELRAQILSGQLSPPQTLGVAYAPASGVAARVAQIQSQLAKAGLKMPADKIQRAAEMGHDTVLFHGTAALDDFPSFSGPVAEEVGVGDFGIHADPAVKVAEKFATGSSAKLRDVDDYNYFESAGPRILPMTGRTGQILDLPDMGSWRDPANWFSTLNTHFPLAALRHKPNWVNPRVDKVITALRETARQAADAQKATSAYDELDDISREFQEQLINTLQKHNIDTIRYNNYTEGTGGPSYLFTHPNQLRSIFAKYDPTKAASADLLASLAPVAVVGGASRKKSNDK